MEGEGWGFGPFFVERKTSLTALAAFFISLTTFLFTLSDQVRGSSISIGLPRQMATFTVNCFPKDVGFDFLKFAVPMRISNTSAGKYTIDIPSPSITVTLFDKEYKYRYQGPVQYTQLPGRNVGQYCKKPDDSKSDYDFYPDGLGIKYLPDENLPLLEQGKSWERTLLISPVYVEDCTGSDCERTNYRSFETLK